MGMTIFKNVIWGGISSDIQCTFDNHVSLHYNGSWRVFTSDMIRSFDLDGSFINVKVDIDVISHSGLRFFPRFITFIIEPINRRLSRRDCAS